jgi:hypothetical protein
MSQRFELKARGIKDSYFTGSLFNHELEEYGGQKNCSRDEKGTEIDKIFSKIG